MGELMYGNAMHIRAQAKIDAGKVTQKSGNERRAATSDLERFSQSMGNRRALDAAGTNINAITENISRNLEASTSGTFMGRVAAAEELGANAAAASAAGAAGSSVEAYNDTVRLNNAMKEEQQARRLNSENISASNSQGQVLTDTVATLNNNVEFADQDYTEFVDDKKMSTFDRISTIGMVAAAAYVGGPGAGAQAASTVIGLSESNSAAQRGDFAGAQSSLMEAIQNGMAAFKAAHATSAGPAPAPKHYNASGSVMIK